MEWWLFAIIIFIVFFSLLLANVPIAFAFGVTNLAAFLIYSRGDISILRVLSSTAYESVSSFTYSAVPLFTLMGTVLYYSGLVEGLYVSLGELLGRIPGRLAVIATAAGAVFGAASGSSMASVATIGSSLGPEMVKRGYAKWLAFGSIAASGGLAVLIPPSNLMIIFGGAAGLPIGKLLIGGIVPGIILACLMAFFIVIASVLNPKIAPSYDVVTATGLQRFRAVLGFVPVLVIVVSVLGSIFVGLATPTEAAAVGAFMAFVLAAIYRRLTFVVCRKALLDTLNVTCMVFLIVMASMAFSQILALSGIADGLTRTVVGLDITPLSTMILMNIVVLILGSLMDPVSIILIVIPVFLPIAEALQFDLIWWALIMMVNIELGLITPPFGLNLFVAKSVAPAGTELVQIYRGIWPFVVLVLMTISIMIMFPAAVLWLPNAMG